MAARPFVSRPWPSQGVNGSDPIIAYGNEGFRKFGGGLTAIISVEDWGTSRHSAGTLCCR